MKEKEIALKTECQLRLHSIAVELGLSDRAFAINCGQRNDLINKTGLTLTNDVVRSILQTYPKLSLTYVLWGEGEMFNNDENINSYVLDIFKVMNRDLQQKNAEIALLKEELKAFKNEDSEPIAQD